MESENFISKRIKFDNPSKYLYPQHGDRVEGTVIDQDEEGYSVSFGGMLWSLPLGADIELVTE